MFPTAIHVAAGQAIQKELLPALQRFRDALADKANSGDSIIKIGRTHLADATPIRLGQEFSGYVRQLELSLDPSQTRAARRAGTARRGYRGRHRHQHASEIRGQGCRGPGARDRSPVRRGGEPFRGNANRDGLVECSAELRTIAVSLFSIANNIRWLGSGPRCGFYEVMLPDRQPGSSIMPGKVNPVMCESMMQVCARVLGNDQTIAFAGATGGQFELNIMMPVMGLAILESIQLLAPARRAFVDFLRSRNGSQSRGMRKTSRAEPRPMVTSLNPLIGYDAAAALAKEAFKGGQDRARAVPGEKCARARSRKKIAIRLCARAS